MAEKNITVTKKKMQEITNRTLSGIKKLRGIYSEEASICNVHQLNDIAYIVELMVREQRYMC